MKKKTYLEVNGPLVALPTENVAHSEIVSILSWRAISKSIGIAWVTAFCTSGFVIAEEAWAIVNVTFVSKEAWNGLYPGTGIPSMNSTVRITSTKFFWTVPGNYHHEVKGEKE